MTAGIPITDEQHRLMVKMRADGHTPRDVALQVGCHPWTVLKHAPGYPGKVPNDRLREAFLASHVTASDVARYLGWYCTRNRPKYPERSRQFPDTSRVRRTLGLLPTIGHGYSQYRHLIDWETGSLIAEAIGVAAWAVLDDDVSAAA